MQFVIRKNPCDPEMLDPSRTNSSPRTFGKKVLRLTQDGRVASTVKSPRRPRHHSQGSSRRASSGLRASRPADNSPEVFEDNAAKQRRFVKKESNRNAHLDNGHESEGSLNPSQLVIEAPKNRHAKSGSSGTLNTSRSSVDSSSSASFEGAIKGTESGHRGTVDTPGRSGLAKQPSRVTFLRQEMSQSLSSLGNLMKSTELKKVPTSEEVLDAKHDQVKLTRTPQPSRKKSQKDPPHLNSSPKRNKKLSRSKSGSHTPSDTVWRRNSSAPKRSKSDVACHASVASERSVGIRRSTSGHGVRDTLENRKLGGSIRNILRNKRKLEKELNTSDIFHYVLHKVPLATKVEQEQKAVSTAKDTVGPKRLQSKQRLSLSRFLRMKQNSEKYVDANIVDESADGEESETWQSRSLDLSKSLSHLNLDQARFGNGPTQNLLEEDDDIADGESAIQASVQGNQKTPSTTSVRGNPVITDPQVESQNNVGESRTAVVHELAIVDQNGRRCHYSGPVTAETKVPHGQGRLHYAQEGIILDGEFFHGTLTGVGRSMDMNTGEDYTGTFLFDDLVRHGFGETTFSDGKVFRGSYNHGVPTYGVLMYSDGSRYVGEVSPGGQRSGRGTFMFPNRKAMYFGKFVNDRAAGSHGILQFADGSRKEGAISIDLNHPML